MAEENWEEKLFGMIQAEKTKLADNPKFLERVKQLELHLRGEKGGMDAEASRYLEKAEKSADPAALETFWRDEVVFRIRGIRSEVEAEATWRHIQKLREGRQKVAEARAAKPGFFRRLGNRFRR